MQVVLFVSAYTSDAGGYKQQNINTIQDSSKRSEGSNPNMFEFLKHDRNYVNAESQKSTCVIMKCNTVTTDGL